jgi:eukaryotic-like serine/threonine-protein kinase
MASPALDRVVKKCLAKSPDDRWQTTGDLLSELEWIADSGSNAGIPAPVAAKRRNRERMWQLAAGLAAVLLLASLAWIVTHRQIEPPPPAQVHFQIPVPDKLNFFPGRVPAVSPDGERIAFTASSSLIENGRLFIRSLNAPAAAEIPLPGVDIRFPFWSPDGRQIAFSGTGSLRRVDVSGGPPVTICTCDGGIGGTWNREGVILSASRNGRLYRVSASGGDPKPLRPLAEGETVRSGPNFFPMESTTSISP